MLAFAGGGVLFGLGGFPLPFLISAIIMLISLLVMTLLVREPEEADIPQDKAKKPDAKKLTRSEKKSLVFLLLAVFFYFGSFNAIETFFTLYATNTLGMDSGAAAMTLSVFPMVFIAFAVPSGYLGAQFGRRRVMMIGLIGFLSLALPMTFIVNIWLTRCMMLIGGVFWACIAINGMPMVVRFSGKDNVGAFVGYYYFFSFNKIVI